jgi:hypothetical protein
MPSGTQASLAGVWGASPSAVFAVGVGGTILRYDGAGWTPMSSGTTTSLAGVWGTSATNVFAAGGAGLLLHFDGAVWAPMTSGASTDLVAVWGTAADDVYALGLGGAILRYDGASWAPMSSGTAAALHGGWSGAAGDSFAVGDGGTLLLRGGALPTAAGGDCPRPIPLYCGSPAASVGDTTHRAAAFTSYGCAGRADTGPEAFYRLDSPITGHVTARLAPHAADLDLVVVGADQAGGCDPASRCLAASQNGGTGLEEVTFPVTAGHTYYLIVDGYAGAASGYQLDLACLAE